MYPIYLRLSQPNGYISPVLLLPSGRSLTLLGRQPYSPVNPTEQNPIYNRPLGRRGYTYHILTAASPVPENFLQQEAFLPGNARPPHRRSSNRVSYGQLPTADSDTHLPPPSGQ
jgi:hypothetical protein